MDKNNVLKVFTAFSGYDSQCLALNRLSEENPDFKYELVGWSEIDEYACKAHDILFPEAADRNYGDISKVDWNTVPDFDLFTYSSPCFIAGTMVLTQFGGKNIEDVKIGDNVITHTGKYQKVLGVSEKDYSGDIYVVMCNGEQVECTPNHPFYVYIREEKRYAWIEAKDLDESVHQTTIIREFKTDGMTPVFGCFPFKVLVKKGIYTKVYNLSVEEDESYTANNFVVHNCTDFSLAGRQAGGEEGSGTRSSLLWECRRCIEAKKPKYLLLENVTNLVSKKFLPLFLKWVETVDSFGYDSFWETLNAKDFGIPQNRDRVFLVSIRRDSPDDVVNYNFPNKIERKCKMEDILETAVGEKYFINQERVNEWVVENENRIADYISERGGISRDDIIIDKQFEDLSVKSNSETEQTKQEEIVECCCDDVCEVEQETVKEDNIMTEEDVFNNDVVEEAVEETMSNDKPKKNSRSKKNMPKTTKKGHLVKRIATPVRSDGYAPTLMATGYATADYKNFYSMGHFPKLGIFEVWKEDKEDNEQINND